MDSDVPRFNTLVWTEAVAMELTIWGLESAQGGRGSDKFSRDYFRKSCMLAMAYFIH